MSDRNGGNPRSAAEASEMTTKTKANSDRALNLSGYQTQPPSCCDASLAPSRGFAAGSWICNDKLDGSKLGGMPMFIMTEVA